MSIRAPHILIAAVCWLFLGAYGAVSAAPRSADQFYHTQWTTQDGAPPGIQTLVQTADGYLWMSNGSGLFRFDGVHFERISRVGGRELLSTNISTLWASERGMWIGYRFGGATYMEGDRLTHYIAGEGLPVGTTLRFAQDGSGSMWAGTTVGLFRLVDGKWSQPGSEWNLPVGRFFELVSDKAGTIWAIAEQSCRSLRRDARRFADCTLPSSRKFTFLLPRDGAVWMISLLGDDAIGLQSAAEGGMIVIDELGRKHNAYPFTQGRFDREGYLWLADEQGARRFDVPAAVATSGQSGPLPRDLRARDLNGDRVVPLTGRYVSAVVEDQEGSIWFATSGGLDRLRAPALSRADLPSGSMTYAIAASHAGELWIGTSSKQLFRISSDLRQELVPGPEGDFGCFYVDPNGALWVGMENEIWQRHADRWQVSRLPMAQRSRTAAGEIQSMAMDASGAMWVSVVRVGVYRVVGDEWTLWGGRTDMPPEAATIVASDQRGRVWFGYVDGKVALLDRDRVTIFTAKDGLEAGTVFAIVPRGEEHIWIGGERGMFHFDGQAFRPIRRAEGAFASISGIAELDTGDLWLNTADGAVRIEASEARKALSNPPHAVDYKLFNYLDGMPGVPIVIRPLPTLVVDKQQRVWFATSDGVAWTDAQPRMRNEVIPTVLVKSIRADDRTYQWTASQPLQLPVRTRNLEIAYTALSLAIPERVRFKYRLEGNDSEWQDVGTRREAFFTDLPPGKYRFHVIASNNDGLWNETGAALEFVIPPTFMQTPWFTALLVGSMLGIVWLAFAIRFRQAKAQLRWRLEERLVERERIARELHDTFLQGVQGLMLRFQSATERIPKHEPARAMMEEALDRADQVLADGRDKVTSLRSSSQTTTSLPQALSVLGSELAQDYTATFDLSVEGAECDLHPVIREEAFRIGAEALANAFRHAQATRIQVRISYTRRALVLLVRDDGRGFNTKRSQIPAGHWGLKGMEERAARIRAQLTLSSSASGGTSVELKVPARMAFKSGRGVRRISET